MKQPAPIYFTKEGYEELRKEQEDLKDIRKAAVEDLAKARAMGDLSENGYYKSARAKLSSVDHRIREVKHFLRFGKVKNTADDGSVDIGTTVTLQIGSQEKTYNIVGGYESNPSEGKLSHISPLGKALLGKKKGESAEIQTPSGKVVYMITSVF